MYQAITGIGDGSSPVVNLTFPYLSRAHVKAEVDGVEVTFTWTGASQITFDANVSASVPWRVYRDSSLSAPMVDFTDGSVLTETDLDLANLQHQYLNQELSARITVAQTTADGAATAAEDDAASAATSASSASASAASAAASEAAAAISETNAAASATEAAATLAAKVDSADLAAVGGAGLVGFQRSDTGATARTVADKLSDRLDVRDFGAVGDGATDDTLAIQAAFDAASATGKVLFVPAPSVAYRTTDRVTVPNGIRVHGESVTLTFGGTGNESTPAKGSWFYFDHENTGFYLRDDADQLTPNGMTEFSGIGTYRNQPAPAPGWAPTVMSPDFRVEHRAHLDDILLLNPYQGVLVRNTGILQVSRLRGQPLFTGIEVEQAVDIQNWDDIHFWPYWSQDVDVTAYTMDNAVGVRVTRADGLQVGTIFSWGYKWTVEAIDAVGAGSGLAAFHIGRLYADKAGGGIHITANNYAPYGSIGSLIVNSDSGVGSSGAGFALDGSVAGAVDVGSFMVTRAHDEAMKVSGAAHIVSASPSKIENWDRRALGVSAFSADNGATITLVTTPKFAGGAALYNQGATGVITLPGPIPVTKPLASPQGFQSKRVSIADDSVVSFQAPTTEKTVTLHLTPTSVPGAGNPAGSYWLRASASPSAVLIQATHTANVTLFTSPLTGTTGLDGDLGIAAANDGKIYIENRTGLARSFIVTMMGN